MTEKIEWYREVLELEPNSKVFFPLARLLVAENEDGQAIEILHNGLARHPDYLEARLLLIELLYKAGRSGECDAEVKKLGKMFANYAGFWQAWAACLGSGEEQDTASVLRFLAASFLHGPLSLHEVLNRGLATYAPQANEPARPPRVADSRDAVSSEPAPTLEEPAANVELAERMDIDHANSAALDEIIQEPEISPAEAAHAQNAPQAAADNTEEFANALEGQGRDEQPIETEFHNEAPEQAGAMPETLSETAPEEVQADAGLKEAEEAAPEQAAAAPENLAEAAPGQAACEEALPDETAEAAAEPAQTAEAQEEAVETTPARPAGEAEDVVEASPESGAEENMTVEAGAAGDSEPAKAAEILPMPEVGSVGEDMISNASGVEAADGIVAGSANPQVAVCAPEEALEAEEALPVEENLQAKATPQIADIREAMEEAHEEALPAASEEDAPGTGGASLQTIFEENIDSGTMDNEPEGAPVTTGQADLADLAEASQDATLPVIEDAGDHVAQGADTQEALAGEYTQKFQDSSDQYTLRTRSMAEVLAEQDDPRGALDIYRELLARATDGAEQNDLQQRISTLSQKLDQIEEMPQANTEEEPVGVPSKSKEKLIGMLEALARRVEARAQN